MVAGPRVLNASGLVMGLATSWIAEEKVPWSFHQLDAEHGAVLDFPALSLSLTTCPGGGFSAVPGVMAGRVNSALAQRVRVVDLVAIHFGRREIL